MGKNKELFIADRAATVGPDWENDMAALMAAEKLNGRLSTKPPRPNRRRFVGRTLGYTVSKMQPALDRLMALEREMLAAPASASRLGIPKHEVSGFIQDSRTCIAYELGCLINLCTVTIANAQPVFDSLTGKTDGHGRS